MKRLLLGLGLLVPALECSADQQPAAGPQAEVAAAEAAIKGLAAALQSELKAAMQTGGPVAAIGVCNMQATPVSARIAVENGMELSRVSLRFRNPENAPNRWQADVLENFEKRKSAGQDVNTLNWSETVNVDGGREFRFMKAIPTGAVCLQCHGTALEPEVSRVLADLYPRDLATGYQQGDIRGAFVSIRKLPGQ